MSVKKKPLISNHTAARKAIIATKLPSTKFSSNQPLASKGVFGTKLTVAKTVAASKTIAAGKRW